MTLEHRKLDIITWIASLRDERIIDSLTAVKEQSQEDKVLDKFATKIEAKFNLDKIKAEQQWTPPSKERIDLLIEEADIPQTIEQLLEDLSA